MTFKEKFGRIKWAVLVQFVIALFLFGLKNGWGASSIGVNIFAALVLQVLSYLTCNFIVLKKGKSEGHIWLNYFLWLVPYIYTAISK
jgi:formate hydrogenlyase subunit 4